MSRSWVEPQRSFSNTRDFIPDYLSISLRPAFNAAIFKTLAVILATMLHRHLNHQGFTLAAIDDIISRGRWDDWAELRRAVLRDRSLLAKVERVCRPRLSDPFSQRYHFWTHYVEEHRPSS